MKGLYLVTPDWDDTERLVAVTEQAIRGGASVLQYRHKTASEPLRLEQAAALLKLCRRLSVPLIINDHLKWLGRYFTSGYGNRRYNYKS
jgi:thiamine-phosphate pyrophosphorylase